MRTPTGEKIEHIYNRPRMNFGGEPDKLCNTEDSGSSLKISDGRGLFLVFTMTKILISETPCYLLLNQEGIQELGNGTTSARSPSILQYTSFLLSVLCCVIGLVGNAIVIYITGFKKKGNKSKNWFLNLAVADFVFLLVLPINVVSDLKGNWPFGPHVCKMYNFLSNVNIYASIFIITALNIDRVLSVAKPIWHHKFMSPRVCYFTCALIWVVTILASLPTAIYSNEHNIGEEKQCLLGYTEYSISGHITELNVSVTDTYGKTEMCVPSKYNTKDQNTTTFTSRYQENATKDSTHFAENTTSFKPKIIHQRTSSIILKTVTYITVDIIKKMNFSEECNDSDCFPKNALITKWKKMMFTTEIIVITLIVIGFVIPFCVIIICNCIIALKVRKSQTVKLCTLYRIVVTVVLVYFVTWSPLVIAQIIYLVAAQNMNFPLMCKINVFLPLLSSFAFSNCCLNPIMYVLVSKNVRTTLRDSWNSTLVLSQNCIVFRQNCILFQELTVYDNKDGREEDDSKYVPVEMDKTSVL
ncbi:chemerin-like receptor 1 [Discoglossus pictus]